MKTTIFLGNGFNRCTKGNKSWVDLLTLVAADYNVTINDELKRNLYTFLYERIVLSPNHMDDIKRKEESIKTSIASDMGKIHPIDLYRKLVDLNASNLITTNYDYCLKEAYEDCNYSKKSVDASEDIYSIRRNVELQNSDNKSVKIWHIHGEVNYPKSIMLGLDHYCGSISKMDSYLKGTYSFKKEGKTIVPEKIKNKLVENIPFDYYSWIELFFNSNVHILGFGMDYSETDLWWILNKRARLLKELNIKNMNKIYFYGEIDNTKAAMLRDFEVEVVEVETHDNDYYQQNVNVIEELKMRI